MHALIDTVYSSRSTFFVYPNIPCIKFFRNLMSYEFQGTCIEVLHSVGVISVKRMSYRILLSKMCINKLFYAPVKSSRKTMWKLSPFS